MAYGSRTVKTYLKLCQEANRLSGMQGTVSTTSPTSGYQVDLCEYVKQAWIDIQNYRKDWPWMRLTNEFYTVAGTTSYSNSSAVAAARWLYFTYTDSNSDEVKLTKIPYDKYILDNVANDTQGEPTYWAEDPTDRSIWLNPPDGVYTVTGHYIGEAETFTSDSDYPAIPPTYEMLIAYMGAMYMCQQYGNSNLYQRNKVAADHMLGQMLRDWLPGRRVQLRGIA